MLILRARDFINWIRSQQGAALQDILICWMIVSLRRQGLISKWTLKATLPDCYGNDIQKILKLDCVQGTDAVSRMEKNTTESRTGLHLDQGAAIGLIWWCRRGFNWRRALVRFCLHWCVLKNWTESSAKDKGTRRSRRYAARNVTN